MDKIYKDRLNKLKDSALSKDSDNKGDYFIFKKQSKSSDLFYYYVSAIDPTTNHRITKSTKCTDLDSAKKEAFYLYKSGDLFTSKRKTAKQSDEGLLFSEYAADWWTPTCSYVLEETARGKTLTPDYIHSCRLKMNNHIVPYFKDYKLSEIDVPAVQNWLVWLSRKQALSPRSIKNLRANFSTILKDAHIHRLIAENPFDYIKPQIVHSTGHGRPTEQEILQLFSTHENWNNNHLLMIANYLASITGLRNGEVRALQWRDLTDRPDSIIVRHSYSSHSGLKTTKSGKARIVAVPHSTWSYLTKTPGIPDQYIFSYNGTKPVGAQTLERSFKNAFIKIGVSERDQILRKLSFHSWRVNANSILVESSDLTAKQVRTLIGHESESMTDLYFKQSDAILNKARGIIEKTPLAIAMGSMFENLSESTD